MTTAAETSAPPPPGPPKRRRGLETAADMVRSLGLVLLVVVALWLLAQPGRDAEQRVREVDQRGDLAAWTATVPGAPTPRQPPGWRPTVSQYVRSPVGLRLGWHTAGGTYAEFAATTGPGAAFIEDVVGSAPTGGTVDVDGVAWRRYAEADGSISLVREVDDVTVVVGTRRSTASLDDVVALARRVVAGAG